MYMLYIQQHIFGVFVFFAAQPRLSVVYFYQSYLSDYCQPVSSNPGRRNLRSAARGDLLSHRQEQPITDCAVLPWQARPRGTQCLRRSMISSYLSPRSGVS